MFIIVTFKVPHIYLNNILKIFLSLLLYLGGSVTGQTDESVTPIIPVPTQVSKTETIKRT